ncbi:MAG TPA: RDD family protein [Candidatus Limnocylindrales bacterium]|nr:RDD family protein [Candidatus Limnocylindrales bacterium]
MTEPPDAPPPPSSPSAPRPPAAWEAPVEEVGPAPGVRFADHGARLLSYLLDSLILTVVIVAFAVVVGVIIAASGSQAAAVSLTIVLVLGVIVLSIGYFPWFWMRGGQTPGMRPFRLYVVRDRDGGPVSGGAAALRLLGYVVNSFALYIGFAWILIDKRRRGWHDLIAGTVVIQR